MLDCALGIRHYSWNKKSASKHVHLYAVLHKLVLPQLLSHHESVCLLQGMTARIHFGGQLSVGYSKLLLFGAAIDTGKQRSVDAHVVFF